MIADDFFETLDIAWVDIDDIILTGSLANYNWSKFSDVDIHILVDYEDVDDNVELVREYFMSKKNLWNDKHDITIKDKINAADFEATAITAAIGFEEKAVKLYALRAEEATDPEEKKLYNWLSVWEKTHLKKLMALEASLMESVWQDNNFWPF